MLNQLFHLSNNDVFFSTMVSIKKNWIDSIGPKLCCDFQKNAHKIDLASVNPIQAASL